MQTNELILDCDDFKVWYDHLNQNYVFQSEHNDPILVELIATLKYDINAKMQWFADFDQIFLESYCSGERVTDDNIIYYWFKEI